MAFYGSALNKRGLYNVPFGHKPQRFTKPFITKVVNQVKRVSELIHRNNWDFVCADFREVLNDLDENCFIYCDPPYAGRHTDYFNSWSESDEHDLFVALSTTSGRFILPTWHSNQWRSNLFLNKYSARFTVLKRQHFYHVGPTEKNRNPITEAIVANYDIAEFPIKEQPHQSDCLKKQE